MYGFYLSNSDDIDLSSLRVALINHIYAKRNKKDFVLIAEDDGGEVVEILSLFGIECKRVLRVYRNLKFYRHFATNLLMNKRAFACFCTDEEIARKKKKAKQNNTTYFYDGTCERLNDKEVLNNENPFSIRIKKPKESAGFYDEINKEVSFKPNVIDSFIILKKDKTPTYDFACAIDDMLDDIDFIIKDKKYMVNTIKQKIIRDYLGYKKKIKYAHIPQLIVEKEEFLNIKNLLENGFLPSAIVNYLLSLGNNNISEKIFDLRDAETWFEIREISKTATKFDIEKLKQINKEHIKVMDTQKLASFIGYSSKNIGKLIKFYTKDYSTIKEIKEKIDTIFSLKTPNKNDAKDSFLLRDIIQKAPTFDKFEEFSEYLLQKSGFDKERLLELLGFLMTGCKSGPNLNELYIYLKDDIKEITRG